MARISKKDNEQIIKDLITENGLLKSQLTKAKELLERLVTVCKIVPLGTNYNVVKQAEQFLNSERVIPCSYISCRNCDREDCKQKTK